MTQLSQTTQQNASSSEELAATAEEMSGQAEQLQQLMSFFKLRDGGTSSSPAARGRPTPRRTTPARAPLGRTHAVATAVAKARSDSEELDDAAFARF